MSNFYIYSIDSIELQEAINDVRYELEFLS